LANLWDVTDRDLDRFTKATLDRWGLFDERAETFRDTQAGRKVTHQMLSYSESSSSDDEPIRPIVAAAKSTTKDTGVSLCDAVAASRDACVLRYLTGAAPIVYGIPVKLAKLQ
jgi:separase